MHTTEITPEVLRSSVISVPPLARNADYSFNKAENQKMVDHLAAGGVTTLLYGGNAILHHVAINEYAKLLEMLTEIATADMLMIPSVGPGFGMLREQASILSEFDFPTAMLIPTRDMVTSTGVASAVRHLVEKSGKPAVLYIKHDGFVDVPDVQKLMADGLLSWIKYAIVRDDTANDDYLRALSDAVGTERIISGMGEQPAIIHMRDFQLAGFTSGVVCVAPRLSMEMLHAIQQGNTNRAEELRNIFAPLEDYRNDINPVRVLHTAVTRAEIGDMGPLIPLLCEVTPDQQTAIEEAARELLKQN